MSYVLEGIVHYISKFMMILFTYFTHMPKLKHDKSPKWIIKFLPNTIKKYCFPFCFNLAGLTPSSKMYMSTYNEMTYDGKNYKTLVYLCVRKNACVRSLSHVKFHNKYTNFLKIMYPKNIYIYMCDNHLSQTYLHLKREERDNDNHLCWHQRRCFTVIKAQNRFRKLHYVRSVTAHCQRWSLQDIHVRGAWGGSLLLQYVLGFWVPRPNFVCWRVSKWPIVTCVGW